MFRKLSNMSKIPQLLLHGSNYQFYYKIIKILTKNQILAIFLGALRDVGYHPTPSFYK